MVKRVANVVKIEGYQAVVAETNQRQKRKDSNLFYSRDFSKSK